ncbi:probable RNA-dependent RNA polymerase 2 [Ananas comosus]|uniref:RNA-dependent RNA polymerase n=1 Tax=Ananas comosus TaxID=4615 RepID=A0A6P5GP81_ANACO|nr:probable RNA-dependent RNA polymerase 2 [Ananas comosus]
MAVDFAKTGAPADMPRVLKPKEYPDFMGGIGPSSAIRHKSIGVLGKLYRAVSTHIEETLSFDTNFANSIPEAAYDRDLEVEGFEAFLEAAQEFYDQYSEKLSSLMNYYGAEYEDEILTGNLRNRSLYLVKDRNRYGEMKDRILVVGKGLIQEVGRVVNSSCADRRR